MRNVAADSHQPTNVYGLSGQYSDAGGPAAYNSTYGGAVLGTDPLPANGCVEPLADRARVERCVNDGQIQSEIAHVVCGDHLPAGLGDIYFMVTPNGLGSCIRLGPDELRARRRRPRHGLLRLPLQHARRAAPLRGDPVQRRGGPLPVGQPASQRQHRRSDDLRPQPRAQRDGHRPVRGRLDRRARQRERRSLHLHFGPALGGSGRRSWNQVDPRRPLLPPGGVEQRRRRLRGAGRGRLGLVLGLRRTPSTAAR